MSPISGYIIVSLLFTVCYFGSLISFLTDFVPGKCEMTYMFEYPQFVRIANDIDDEYKRYGLYAYSEGRLTERARNMQFDGIPVLFIPGSAGSHKQVRSLASIALRKSLNSRMPFHFNYFTIDFNNELSGLNGALLEDQLDYVNRSIATVLKLYEKRKNPATSIVLVGHSMGGVIAKAILSTQNEDSSLVPLVIALSAPLRRPVIELDHYYGKFYERINNFTIPKQTTFISISGGYDDYLIPPYLTAEGHLSLVSTCVPKSWVSADHLSVLWCKQLILAINRALFESVDIMTKQISTDHDNRLAVFHHHLIKHSGTKIQHRDRYQLPLVISSQGEWFESIYRQYSVRLHKGTRDIRWYMIPINLHPQSEAVTVVALNMKTTDWVFACPAVNIRAASRVCEQGKHLTQLTEIAPSLKYKRRMLRLNLFELKRNYTSATHVVLRVMPSDEPVIFHIDVHSPSARKMTVDNPPKWFTFQKDILIEKTEEKMIEYNLELPYFNHIIQTYKLFMEPIECSSHSHHATASLSVPWDHHEMHGFVTEFEKSAIYMRLYKSRPPNMANESANIRLTLDPTCRYKISLQTGIHFGNIARFYSPLLIANIAAVILMTLRSQLINIGENEQCSVFFTAIKEGAKPYYVITTVRILSKMASSDIFAKLFAPSDWQLLADENLDFIVLPLILYIVSVGVVWLLAIVLSVSFICFESTIHKLALKFVSKTFKGTAAWTDHIMNAFEKIPGVVAAFLIMISFSTSGGLAICLATGFYFLKLTQMAQDFIEDLVKGIAKSIGKKLKDRILTKLKERWRKYRQSKVKAIEQKEVEIDELKPAIKDETKSDGESSSSTSSIASSPDIELEKPLEFEILSNDTVTKVTGDKLVELISSQASVNNEETTATTEEVNETNEQNEETTKNKDEFKLPKIDISWIKEIIENNEIFFHFTIFMIYFIVACLNIPSVLTWAHNYKYSQKLEPDPALIPGIILSVCTLPLWQFEFPRVDRQFYKELSNIVYFMSIICLIFGVVSVYRLSYILSATVALLTLHQLFAIQKIETETNVDEKKDDEEEMSYKKRVKAKWE